MSSLYRQEEIYRSEDMDMDVDENNDSENWEVERHLLKQQIKELENALDKAKKFHRKFVDDVIQSEELRNKDFEREKREMIAVNKRQVAEIRQLTKEKDFYESTCAALMKEKEAKEVSSRIENSGQSTSVLQQFLPTTCSTTDRLAVRSKSTVRYKSSQSDSKYKISTKLFDDNKKLKEKISKLTKSNATLRLQVKQLENFKNKIQSRKQQQVADQQEMQGLLKVTTRTNKETFNKLVLSQLNLFNRMQPNIEYG